MLLVTKRVVFNLSNAITHKNYGFCASSSKKEAAFIKIEEAAILLRIKYSTRRRELLINEEASAELRKGDLYSSPLFESKKSPSSLFPSVWPGAEFAGWMRYKRANKQHLCRAVDHSIEGEKRRR